MPQQALEELPAVVPAREEDPCTVFAAHLAGPLPISDVRGLHLLCWIAASRFPKVRRPGSLMLYALDGEILPCAPQVPITCTS